MNKLEEELRQIKGYRYRLWEYYQDDSVLTFRAEHPDKKHHNVEITFLYVCYFQFPSTWTGDFYPASDTELFEIVNRAGITSLGEAMSISYIKEHFHLYKADAPDSTIYVLGDLNLIAYDVEPIID